jgi:monooxygenase
MTPEHVDVLIVGAGISGIGAGFHIQDKCPGRTYAILEGRDVIGGTWDLFRYPGIRSDSDMFTLGYKFRPWLEARAIADGPSILDYLRETADEHGIDRHIRFGHRVRRAEWSTPEARWTVQIDRGGEPLTLTCGFLFICTGYYRYDRGFSPEFAGTEDFGGRIVHPQFWPEDLDTTGQRVVVIGSGATAVTLVPALAETAEHVTMLQRSPSYVLALPGTDPIAGLVRRVLPARLAHPFLRWKNVVITSALYALSRRRPKLMRRLFRAGARRALPEGYAVDTHFNPTYEPWDQRLCIVPDGDLFASIASGRADVVTDRIETFTPTGLRLESGQELEADVVVTATGLDLLALGGIELAVDGTEVSLPDHMAYRAMMLSDVPNMAFAIGYTNASWTLKVDLTCEYVCRLLNHMDAHGHAWAMPVNHDPSVQEQPLLDFQAGYVLRALHRFPKAGSKAPWRLRQNYTVDVFSLGRAPVDDGVMTFGGSATGSSSNSISSNGGQRSVSSIR